MLRMSKGSPRSVTVAIPRKIDPSTTRHTNTKVTLLPHHTRAVTAAMAAQAVAPKEEKVKVM